MKNDLILVVGASGMVGSELVRRLKSDGYKVRSTTSKAVKNSNEQVHINLATGEGIKDAFEGVDRAFFLSPPGYADQYAMLSPLIQESKRRGLKKVVLMTAMGANAVETSPFRRAELDLERAALNYNIIRPNWFLQNFHTFWMHGISTQDKILLPAGQAKVSFIDARDIAATAAVLLTSDKFDRQAFDLTGPESIDHAQVASAISRIAGRKISYEDIAPEAFTEGLKGAGLPRDYVQFLGMIMGFLKEGYNERRTNSVKEITGQAPRSIENYVNDYQNVYKK
ncbi:MAG: NmrA family NAD(P)-binding protein [Bdellovibrionales bacterium]